MSYIYQEGENQVSKAIYSKILFCFFKCGKKDKGYLLMVKTWIIFIAFLLLNFLFFEINFELFLNSKNEFLCD